MAETHAYTTSQGGLVQTITHFRRAFPGNVDAATLKKLGFAPNNESYIINVLRFLGLIDEEGKKAEAASKVFNLHDDKEFSEAFGALVMTSYKDLFDLHGEAAWGLDADALIGFFRANDGTSSIVGRRQASTFQLLAGFSGHGDMPVPRAPASRPKSKPASREKIEAKPTESLPKRDEAVQPPSPAPNSDMAPPVGLTVRVEINLPPDGDQATYDRIFRSIRENLLNA